MADPLLALAPRFAAALGEAFGEQYASEGAALRRSDRSDYQADVAMSLGKKLKRPPREIAETLVAKLDVTGICDGVEIAGPGFINLKLSDDFLSREATRTLGDERLGVAKASRPETVVVDYSAPNVAKEMHVGHIRTSVIGDALVRTLEFLGHRVIRQNHLGDWGTPFGMLIEHLLDLGADAAANTARSIADLNLFYQVARAKFDADPSFADRARQRVVLLQGGDEPTLALWRELVDQSKRHFTAVYAKLGVTLTDADVRGESFYNAMLPSVVAELEEKGLARTSDGAVCTFPSGFTGKSGDPLPLIIQKHDGGYGYATTDLAAIRYRART
ncbi:MAG TPA: arginine--tRNA ligase, partial [Polyangiaceae bacterium]|nr:arginine--tRNA ligase [Polyangiaceae bacterium]